MTKYKLMAAAAVLCMAAGADARAEEKSGKSDLRANFRRVALEMSSTEVKNADLYVDSPNSQLSADSKTMIKGVLILCLNTNSQTGNGTTVCLWNTDGPS